MQGDKDNTNTYWRNDRNGIYTYIKGGYNGGYYYLFCNPTDSYHYGPYNRWSASAGAIDTTSASNGLCEMFKVSLEDIDINILGGTLGKNVYGGSYNADINAGININMYNGTLKGTIYGGCDNTGNIERMININIAGGNILGGEDANAIYGAGNGEKTCTKGNIYINLSNEDNNTNINGNIYGGSKYGQASSNITINSTTTNELNVNNLFGGSMKGASTIKNTTININGGTFNNIYGGSDIQGEVENTVINISSGNIQEVYGGGNKIDTVTSNINVKGGTINNVYGGGNSSGVTGGTSINVNGGEIENLYGASNIEGDVGSIGIIVNAGTITNIYGGGNSKTATTTGNVEITVIDGTITNIYGGGNKAETGDAETETKTEVKIAIRGGTITGDVYGGAYSSTVNGNIKIYVGEDDTNEKNPDNNLIIEGSIYGGGRTNSGGEEYYDFLTKSVVGNIDIIINPNEYKEYDIKGSIVASGKNSTIDGTGNILIKNYGTADNIKNIASIQRANDVSIENSVIQLTGDVDRTLGMTDSLYTLVRIKDFKIKNSTTLYLANGANLLETFYSLDNKGNEVNITINSSYYINNSSSITYNRLYLLQGKKLILKNLDAIDGEVHGMTFFGLYKYDDNNSIQTGIYNSTYKTSTKVTEADTSIFNQISYVQGKHYYEPAHNTSNDGFYTNFNYNGYVKNKIVTPTPEEETYYQWIAGNEFEDIWYETTLVATNDKQTLNGGNGGEELLALDGLKNSNYTKNYKSLELEFIEKVGTTGLSYTEKNSVGIAGGEALNTSVKLTNKENIPDVTNDSNVAMYNFALNIETGNVGWQNKGEYEILGTQASATINNMITEDKSNNIKIDNSDRVPELKLSLYNSIYPNTWGNGNRGSVIVDINAIYVTLDNVRISRKIHIVINLKVNRDSTSYSYYSAGSYKGAIIPGKEFEKFTTQNTNISNKGTFSAYYTTYLNNYNSNSKYDKKSYTSYEHILTIEDLPEDTKITMIDLINDKYYYYFVKEADEKSGKKEYKFTEFTEMGTTNKQYSADSSYYNESGNYVYEQFIFQVNFEDAILTNNLENKKISIELRKEGTVEVATQLDTTQYSTTFNVYKDKDTEISLSAESDKEKLYKKDALNIGVSTNYTYAQTSGGIYVYNTQHFDEKQAVKITFYKNETQVSKEDLKGVSIINDNKSYYVGDDGAFRVKLADAITSVKTSLEANFINSNLKGNYTMKLQLYGSIDGKYHSETISNEAEISFAIINEDYVLITNIEDKQRIVENETGKTLNTEPEKTNLVEIILEKFELKPTESKESTELTNPKIYISLLRRDYTEVISTKYNLYNLADYIEKEITITNKDGTPQTKTIDTTEENSKKEYFIAEGDAITNIDKITLKLKENLVTGTYKINFTLYDGEEYIGEEYEYIIIK